MSKNSVHNRAAKRNARAKTKRESISRGKATPEAVQKKKMAKLFDAIGDRPDFENVLNHAMKQARKGNVDPNAIRSSNDVVEGLRKMTGEVFKMYCYITLVNEMIAKKVIEETIAIDLPGITRTMIDMDTRIGKLVFMSKNPDPDGFAEGSELYIQTEALDIATTLQTFTDILYEEIARLEPHTLTIEETLSRLSDEVLEGNESQRRMTVLSQLAYRYLADIKIADDEAAAQKSSALQEDNTGGTNAPEAVA